MPLQKTSNVTTPQTLATLPAPAVQIAPADLAEKVRALPPIVSAQQEVAFANLLKFTVDLRGTIEAHYAPLIEAAHAAHKLALAARNSHTDSLDDAERRLRKALADWLDTPAAQAAHAADGGETGVKLRRGVELVIDDVNAIPREFLVPDEKKILKVLRAGVAVPGCRAVDKKTVAVSKA